MATMRLSIATQEAALFDGEVESVTVPTTEGVITVLPHHRALVALLKAGELTYRTGNGAETLVVAPGFVRVHRNVVTVLADSAIAEADVTEEAALEAQRRAQEAMETVQGDTEQAIVTGTIERTLAELRAVRRRRPAH